MNKFDQLKASGRTPKIFTSEQIDEAAQRVYKDLVAQFGEFDAVDMLIGVTSLMCELGLGKPEDFYE